MKVLRDSSGTQTLELFEGEMCEQLQVTSEQIRQWVELFPVAGSKLHPERERDEAIYHVSREQMELYEQFAKILKSGMTVKQVRELAGRDIRSREQGKAGKFVEMYSLLAEECPPGITAHAMRSYCTLFLYQNRKDTMLLSRDLSRAASIPEASAMRHIKYLQAVGLLSLSRAADNSPRWDFAFVPKALSRYYPS